MAEFADKPTVHAVLNSSTLLSTLGEEAMEELARVSHLAYAERGEIIWLHGSQVGFFGIVGTGFVKMVRSVASGTEVTIEIMGPGQAFGLLGSVEGTGCPLSARSVTNLWYLKVPKAKFLDAFGESSVTRDIVFRRTTSRLRQSYDVVARMSNARVETRIAAVLLHLAESYGEESEGGLCVGVPLTRQDIAEMVGTTVETAIRVMSRWQKEGRIETHAHVVTIKDLDSLME